MVAKGIPVLSLAVRTTSPVVSFLENWFTVNKKEKMSDAKLCDSQEVFNLIIVGGGLSGLIVANEYERLEPTGSWRLLEAQSALGGRLKNDDNDDEIDLGGAWFWPRFQPRLSNLVSSLSIKTFEQPDDPSSTRFVGGAFQLITKLSGNVPQSSVLRNSAVTSCQLVDKSRDGKNCVCLRTSDNESLYAERVVFAAPPKILSQNVNFNPPLSQEKQRAMTDNQTWMAGVTKVALIYPSRFWEGRNASNMGLPSSFGPGFQVYDSSTEDGRVVALTLFTLVDPDSDAAESDDALAEQCASQMQKVWSAMRLPGLATQAKSYSNYHVKRWPMEHYISEDKRPKQVNPHPEPVPALSTSEWDGVLLFAGTETDLSSPGVMEGAVGAAMRVAQELRNDS